MKLSVIIPIYRVEQTLDRCIESVVGQDIDDCEILLIDDGSPDRCPAMCDQWAARDRRISVVHKQNGGLSDARNAGLERAKGDWVTFVDSDDFVEKGTYRQLLALLEQEPDIDLLEFPVVRWYGSEKQERLDFKNHTYDKAETYWIEGNAYDHCYAWNKIYRRQLFSEVRFPKGKLFEDVRALAELLKHAQKVATTDRGCYYYCWNPSGITATADGTTLRQLLDAHLEVLAGLKKKCGEAFSNYYLRVANIQSDVCELTGEPPRLTREKTSIVSALKHPKLLFIKLFGLKYFCLCNRRIHTMKSRS